jgi:hypothetical protein
VPELSSAYKGAIREVGIMNWLLFGTILLQFGIAVVAVGVAVFVLAALTIAIRQMGEDK